MPYRTLRRTLLVATAATALAACGNDDGPTAPGSIAGTYRATTFRVAEAAGPSLDMLAAGVSLTVTIAPDDRTTGTFVVPAAFTESGRAETLNMAGTAVRTGNTVRFVQDEDSFVRDLDWTVSGRTLQVVDQQAGDARFTVTLTRQ